MNIFVGFTFFVLGLIFGSFFNVVGIRLPKKESIVYPGSHCPHCNHPLRWYENIPVLSYVFLRGRCRVCREKISPIYPIMELVTGFLFTFSYFQIGWNVELILVLLFVSLLVIITVSDLYYMVIPNRILLIFFLLFVSFRILIPTEPFWDAYLAAFIGFTILYILAIISRGGMGGGDIKLFATIGIVLGTKATLMTLFLSSLIGAIFGIIVILIKGYKKRMPIPFGPFIAIGALLSYFYTDSIIHWYLHLLF
ncbi:prepilin peptidase [Fervidibacillus halotolerans]|uniref:Prepilin peptidase n=1 Tax=Fervidibacillus halotolerans TaxID=2980027 RepID=A0A9E8M006_9BACI|nr:A24 family peptidase [Fervidibacillus halotolerans]WAA12837.1 prepilin peptidase [Fervidibacillus halotolerans]